MKHPYRETVRRLARQYHRHHPADFSRGDVLTYHRYEGLDPDRLTWWGDFTFILNDYRVSVAWIHPRMAFQDRLEEEAGERVRHLSMDFLFGSSEPQYKKLGNSRKKIVSWQAGAANHADDITVWATAFEQEVVRLARETNLLIQPTLKANWTRYALAVDLCVPVEMRNEADVRRLAGLTRRLLKCETTLSREFSGYVYGSRQWAEEGWSNGSAGLLHVHQVA